MLIASKPFHRIASGDSSLFKDCKVKATPTALQKSLHDFWAAKPNAELETRHSWLGDNKLCGPNPEAITNVNSFLKQALRCEVFAERSPGQI
jgi:hypothetical protein